MSSQKSKFWVGDIEEKTNKSHHYRRVLYTGPNIQLVTMCLKPGQEIGMETHEKGDQFIRIESGSGALHLDKKKYRVSPGFATVIPEKVAHNLINTDQNTDMHIYITYSPPEHAPSTKQLRKPKGGYHHHH